MFSIKFIMISCWLVVKVDQLSNIFFCSGVRQIRSSPSAKNWDKVIPKPLHTFSKVGSVGTWFLRYQVDIVDCVKPEYLANSYSDQFRRSIEVL